MKGKKKGEPPEPTFGEAANAWARQRFETLAHNSIVVYKPCLRRVLNAFGDKPFSAVTRRDAEAFLSGLAEQGFARRTVTMHKDILRMVTDYAISAGMAQESPVLQVRAPRGLRRGERELPTDDALNAVRKGISAPFGLYAGICLYAGLRRGEALALRYQDIDRKAGVIRVSKSVEFWGNRPHVKPPKTENGVRSVPLIDALLTAIPATGTGYLFHAPDTPEKPLTLSQFRKLWDGYCAAIGYKLTPHQLRHGFATMLYEAGIGDRDAQSWMGHADINMTRNVYTHIREARAQKSASLLNDYANGL